MNDHNDGEGLRFGHDLYGCNFTSTEHAEVCRKLGAALPRQKL